MKLSLTNLSYDARWYDFETRKAAPEDFIPDRVYLKIRPRPLSKADIIIRNGAIVLSGEDNCASFKYSLVNWKNVTDHEGGLLKCTDDIKQAVFDFGLGGIPAVVMDIAREFEFRTGAEEKNS
jgi:hypothetical protein